MGSGRSELVEVTGEILINYPSQKAIRFYDGYRRVWLPRSQIEIEPHEDGGRLSVVTMPEWLALKKGLI